MDKEVFEQTSERYTITQACSKFPISRPTLRKRLKAAGQKPDKDHTYSGAQIKTALNAGPLSPSRYLPGATSAKIEEIKARCIHVELRNSALLKELVGRAEIESELERIFGCITSILNGSALSSREKKELNENVSSWPERLQSVAKAQGSGDAAATEEVVEVPTAEHRTELQRIQDRESKARTLTWRLKNDIVTGVRLMRTDVFAALELIFVTIAQTIHACHLPLSDRETLSRQISDIETAEELVKKLLMLCRPKELLLPSSWSEKYRLAPADSPKPGRWHCYPFQVQPMDAIADPSVSSLTMMFASQLLGKSSILESQLLWAIDQSPCTIVAVFPTHTNAVTWSKNRFSPLINSIERVAKLVDEAKPKRRGSGENTTVHKRFPGGWIRAGGSGSAANLRADTAKMTVFEEVDAYKSSAGDDGDVIELVRQRSIRFADAFSIQSSTPGAKGFSRIETCYKASSQHKYFVKCPKCWPKSEPFVIMFDMIRWPKEKSADGKSTKHFTAEAYLQCPFCEAHLTDAERMDMVEKGEWIATNPDVVAHRGYWANAFLVLGQCKRGFSSWLAFFADDFLQKSRLGVSGMRPWCNLVLGESHELEGATAPEYMTLYNRRETYPEYEGSGEIILDEKCGMIVVGVDVQKSPARLELEIVGYGEHDQTWGLEYIVVPGDPERQAVWTQLYSILHRSWRHPLGRRIQPCRCCIDAGYLDSVVDQFCKRSCHRDLVVCATNGKPGFQRRWWRKSKTDPLLTLMEVDYPKELQYRRLRIETPGPEFCHWPNNPRCGYEPSYFEGLTIEKMMMDKAEPRFIKRNVRDRNEPLDIRVMTMCAKELANPNWPKVHAWLATPSEEEDWRPSSERRQALLNKEIPDFRKGPSATDIEERFKAIINRNPSAKKWVSIT